MKLVLTSLLFLSSSAFAMSNESLDAACHARGVQRVEQQAAAYGCTLTGPVTVQMVDNRWYNPSKYIWYVAPASEGCTYSQIVKMVQYYQGECH